MAIDKEFMHFIQIQPSEGFAVSKNYLINIPKKQIIDKRNGKRLPYDMESKILVYEDRQKTWFFDIADALKKNNEAGFVILMIASAYLESNQQYREGSSSNGNSTSYINKALERIFPKMTSDEKEIFVKGVRCGLFHDGITKKGVFINASQQNIFLSDLAEGTLEVNPHKFLESTKQDFKEYIKLLKDTQNMQERDNFETMWNSQKGI